MTRSMDAYLRTLVAGVPLNVAWLVALFGNSAAKGVFNTAIFAASYGATQWIRASATMRLALGSAAIAFIQTRPWQPPREMFFSGIGPLGLFALALLFAPLQAAPLILCWTLLTRKRASP